jgi:two-component system LytT family sensor kinase
MTSSLSHKLSRLFKRTWLQHALFWLGMLTLFSLFRSLRPGNLPLTWESLLLELIPLGGVAASVYLNLHLLLPKFLYPKKYTLYGLALLAITLISAALVYAVFHFLAVGVGEISPHPHPRKFMFFPAYMTFQIIFTMITSFFQFIRENSRLSEIALSVTEIESNRLRAELNSLKAQINPHFLFNTLNNIYSYSLFKSEKTPEMILKLSNLMNYIIYECQADRVSLNKELDFIQNYIELERLRIEDSVLIDLDIHENVEDHRIAPLLFVPFLENAFKHGASVSSANPYIRLHLHVDEGHILHFRSENLLEEPEALEVAESHGGIGLENVRKRLQLLHKGRHDLQITEQDGTYVVSLSIDLNE